MHILPDTAHIVEAVLQVLHSIHQFSVCSHKRMRTSFLQNFPFTACKILALRIFTLYTEKCCLKICTSILCERVLEGKCQLMPSTYAHKSHPLFMMLLLGLTVGYLVFFADLVRQEMADTIVRCLTILIPSMYAMMIVAQLLIRTQLWEWFGKPFRWIARTVFHLPETVYALFLFSQFAGYPVGASMLRTLTIEGKLSRSSAEKLLCVCYGGGPAFLLGLLGNGCTRYIFWVIFLAQIAANHVVCFFLFRRSPCPSVVETSTYTPFSAAVLVESVVSAGTSLLQLCAIMLCFSIFSTVPDALGLYDHLPSAYVPLFQSVLEVSNLVQVSLSCPERYLAFTGLLSFGGCCVLLQIRAVISDVIPMRHFFQMRIATALISTVIAAICFWRYCPTPQEHTVAVSAPIVSLTHDSALTSGLLLLMILLLLAECRKLR